MHRLAFLFLTITGPHHTEHWKPFFAGHENKYSIYVHSKGVLKSSFFKKFKIKRTIPTDWAHTMQAQLAMLAEAYKNENNKKFIFLSETTIPLRDFDSVYRYIMSHRGSEFKFELNQHLNPKSGMYVATRRVFGIDTKYQRKHSQWVVLNRKHAKAVLDHAHFLKRPIYCDNEHFPGTVLAKTGLLKEVKKRDLTYVNWGWQRRGAAHPYTFRDLSNHYDLQVLLNAIKRGYLFARKIDKRCDLKLLDPYLNYMPRED